MQRKAYKEKIKKIMQDKSPDNFSGGDGMIRPCFQKALDYKEMPNKMRLALLIELWYKKNYHTVDELVEPFRVLNDFDEKKTRYYIQWFLEHKVYEYRPYRCQVMIKDNWCLQDKCPKYQYQKK
jgi:DNA primase large subunit